MKNQSLVDLFEAYDKAFDKACHELSITNIPEWRERWFYRFLLINPVWKYAPINILSDRHRHPDSPKINIEDFLIDYSSLASLLQIKNILSFWKTQWLDINQKS